MLELVASGLGDLLNDVVFVGGATTAFYVDDPGAPDVRATDDVDCVVEIEPFGSYRDLEKQLEALGFKHDTHDGVLCRWTYQGIMVDVIPEGEGGYGFTNPWYEEALGQPKIQVLPSGKEIRILSLEYFLATKFAAFENRSGDPMSGHDFEDIITVLDGCSEIETLLPEPGTRIGDYLQGRFTTYIDDAEVIEANIQGSPKRRRVDRIKGILSAVYGITVR